MRSTVIARSKRANDRSTSLRSRREVLASSSFQNFHTLSKVSLYEYEVKNGKVALNKISREVNKLKTALQDLKGKGVTADQLPTLTVDVLGVNLIIDPSLRSFKNDPFIIEKNKRAELKFSNKG